MVKDSKEMKARAEQNVRNLPITGIALAGLLGAGVFALLKSGARRRQQ